MAIAFLLTLVAHGAQAPLDSIRQVLEKAPVQEKVYLHIDNNCYFKGDTIWYKAYVVRADDLTYTDMSSLLYVELMSPDGMLVERQTIAISDYGDGDGCFLLRDSVYSGFYELRAYTRYMMNFCVTEHYYNDSHQRLFYNKRMADDFYRLFGAVYSRVFPVYEWPETEGDFSQKYIVNRPKSRLDKELEENLIVSFYPEGGHLIAGAECTVAFEVTNEEGELMDISGTVDGCIPIKTEYQGRGVFTVSVPENGNLKADFNYKGKNYQFDLPKAERVGCALRLEDKDDAVEARVTLRGLPCSGVEYGVIVLCRGVLKAFLPLTPDSKGHAAVNIDKSDLPTGVNDLIVIDGNGQPLADRLFFVNHHDYDQQHIAVSSPKTDYQPFELVKVNVHAPPEVDHISISVRDGATDEPTYDNGNIMTDLLLSSELKGFVAYPAYYFEADDAVHRRHLDLLMRVQGWRRYDYQALATGAPLRYQPEHEMSVEGTVYPTVDSDEYTPEEVKYWSNGVFGYTAEKDEKINHNTSIYKELRERIGDTPSSVNSSTTMPANDYLDLEKTGMAIYVTDFESRAKGAGATGYAVASGGLKHEVTVEAELVVLNTLEDDDVQNKVFSVKKLTDNFGHYRFSVPPFFGNAILFMKAYRNDPEAKVGKKRKMKWLTDEDAWPDYYVKRDLFYPVFSKKYSYYQCHLPEEADTYTDNAMPKPDGERLSSMDSQLREVFVKKRRRRGRKATDYSKPACVYDSFELYNLTTDYGLSFGKFDMSSFPDAVTVALLGNYNDERAYNVQARMSGGNMITPYVFFRNYKSMSTANPFVSDKVIYDNLRLGRQNEIKLFTDIELRNEDKRVELHTGNPDVTLDFVLMDTDSKRYSYRDRRIIVYGLAEPAEFYHPDCSNRPLPNDFKDYRRTLYWEPEAPVDDHGRLTLTFYNNSKPTRIRISAAGLTTEGKPLYSVEVPKK